jgi:hypothetical protein
MTRGVPPVPSQEHRFARATTPAQSMTGTKGVSSAKSEKHRPGLTSMRDRSCETVCDRRQWDRSLAGKRATHVKVIEQIWSKGSRRTDLGRVGRSVRT